MQDVTIEGDAAVAQAGGVGSDIFVFLKDFRSFVQLMCELKTRSRL